MCVAPGLCIGFGLPGPTHTKGDIVPALLETDSTTPRITGQSKLARFFPRNSVLELAIERAAIHEAEAKLSCDEANAMAIQWARLHQGVPMTVVDGELTIDESEWQRATEYVSRYADQIVASGVRLPTAVRQAVVSMAMREGHHGG